MIKAILFDCFGVLIGPGFWNVYRDAGGDPQKDIEFIESIQTQANRGTISVEDFRQAIADKLGLTVEEFMTVYQRDQVPNEPLFSYIQQLKQHYKIGLLSNANTGVLERVIPADKLALFDAVAISAEIGHMKPEPEAYQYVCEQLGIRPEEAVFTDDQERYIIPAQTLGIHAIQFHDPHSFKQQLDQLLQEQA